MEKKMQKRAHNEVTFELSQKSFVEQIKIKGRKDNSKRLQFFY